MPLLLALLLLAAPAGARPHSGAATPRTAPELSDLALFGMAVGGVFLARRAIRARHRPRD